MSLTLNSIYESMVRQFHTITTDANFQADFVQAVNNVLDQLSFDADLTTALTHITAYTGPVTELSAKHGYILFSGVTVQLIKMGREPRSGVALADAMSEWKNAKGEYVIDKIRTTQSARDADDLFTPTADVVGLGYLGDE